MERLHEVHVLITELLHLEDQRQFGTINCGKRLQQRCVLAEMLKRLISYQLLFFVPFGQTHDRRPDLIIWFWFGVFTNVKIVTKLGQSYLRWQLYRAPECLISVPTPWCRLWSLCVICCRECCQRVSVKKIMKYNYNLNLKLFVSN